MSDPGAKGHSTSDQLKYDLASDSSKGGHLEPGQKSEPRDIGQLI
jgi:hypothetical protein